RRLPHQRLGGAFRRRRPPQRVGRLRGGRDRAPLPQGCGGQRAAAHRPRPRCPAGRRRRPLARRPRTAGAVPGQGLARGGVTRLLLAVTEAPSLPRPHVSRWLPTFSFLPRPPPTLPPAGPSASAPPSAPRLPTPAPPRPRRRSRS